jgi:hypothetical protein
MKRTIGNQSTDDRGKVQTIEIEERGSDIATVAKK